MSGVGVFGQIAAALAPYVGGADTAGLILGFATIIVLFLAIMIFFSVADAKVGGMASLVALAVPLSLVLAVQWFPPWVGILIVIVCVAAIAQKLHSGSGTDG